MAEHAAATLACLSEVGRRAEIVQAGGVEALTVVLHTGTEQGQLAAVHAISSLAQEARSHALGPAKSGLDPLLELAINGGGSARGFASSLVFSSSLPSFDDVPSGHGGTFGQCPSSPSWWRRSQLPRPS